MKKTSTPTNPPENPGIFLKEDNCQHGNGAQPIDVLAVFHGWRRTLTLTHKREGALGTPHPLQLRIARPTATFAKLRGIRVTVQETVTVVRQRLFISSWGDRTALSSP